MHAASPVCNEYLIFTSGATPADLLTGCSCVIHFTDEVNPVQMRLYCQIPKDLNFRKIELNVSHVELKSSIDLVGANHLISVHSVFNLCHSANG